MGRCMVIFFGLFGDDFICIFVGGLQICKCGRNVDTCDTDANRDLTRNPFPTLKPCNVIQPSGSRTSLRDQCFFCFVHILWSFVARSALVPLRSVAIPETVLISLLRHYKQLSSGLHTLSSQSYSLAHACALFCIYRAQFRLR